MARAEGLALSLQRLLVERLRLAVAALRPVENGQVVEAGQRVRMARAERLSRQLRRLFRRGHTLRVIARLIRLHHLCVELWPKLGDGSVRKAAYRGGWKPA
jgi:hypothetical protein